MRYVIAIRKRGGRKGDRVLYYWHRKPHPLQRLPDDPSSTEFVARVNRFNAEADAGEARAAAKPAGTIAWLIDRYLESPEVERLGARTAKNYSYVLRRFEKSFATDAVGDLDAAALYELRDDMRTKPVMANLMLDVLQNMFTWARDRHILATNPVVGVKRFPRPRRQVVWSADAEERFLDAAGPTMRLAYMLGAYTAQRLGDICAMTWAQYDGETIKLRQQKTGVLIEVPCHSALRAALDAAPRRSMMILTTPRGRAFTPSNFNVQWLAAATAAGIDGLQFRDLRRTAIVRLAEAGANAIQIAAVSGHEIGATQKILETYLPRNRAMAKAAIVKLERRDRGTK